MSRPANAAATSEPETTGPTPRGPGRPRISSPEEIEATGIEYLLENGYAGTTFAALAQACGVSKTTLFRHFPSKAALVQTGFDVHLAQLAAELAAQPTSVDAITVAIPEAVVAAFVASMDDEGLWLKRFRVLETFEAEDPGAGEVVHWTEWRRTIARFVGDRLDLPADDVIPASIAGAVQAAYLAVLRRWSRHLDFGVDLVSTMRVIVTALCRSLAALADSRELRP